MLKWNEHDQHKIYKLSVHTDHDDLTYFNNILSK